MTTGCTKRLLVIAGTLFVLCGLQCHVGRAGGQELNLPCEAIEKVAEAFGQTIYETSSQVTGLTDLRTDYLLMEPKVHALDGHQIIKEMRDSIQKMLHLKVQAVKRLSRQAEMAHKIHLFDEKLQMTYPESKKLNVTEFELTPNEHFNNISVNLTMSTVHVPTSVYDQSAAVLNGVAWSATLDRVFNKNYKDDPTLTWQYFGAASGFFRMYPGTIWQVETASNGIKKPDIFDCRLQNWYIQAANTPKDVIILLDTSGSMSGVSIDIAKETVKKIVETLGENDFFNVMKYADKVEYLVPCLNGTLVSANTLNKKKMIKNLDAIETKSMARHDLALTEAMDIFVAMNASLRGARCNKAIMLVTDGVSEVFEKLLAKYGDLSEQVRIFTYLIGREATDSKKMKAVACNSRGYFSHIGELHEIHERVQDYIHVISRPMVIQKADHLTWTNTYMDTAGLNQVITVSRPVYDNRRHHTEGTGSGQDNKEATRNQTQPTPTKSSGVLLGVVGADIPITELKKTIEKYKLGHDGYAFAINNNGYVTFHPDLKNLKGKLMSMVDISEVEQSDGVSQLRERMLRRETGSLHVKTKSLYDDSRRTVIKDKYYYFTDIPGTPFSLGLCLLNGRGRNWIESARRLDDVDISAFRTGDLTIAPWPYCQMAKNEPRPVDRLIQYLMYGKDPEQSKTFQEKCNKDLIQGLLFDAEATRSAYTAWTKENWDEMNNDIITSQESGVELVFIGTKGGLTRYMSLVAIGENLTEQDFIERHRSTAEEIYYKRAVNNGEEVFTYSIPFDAGKKMANINNLMITASTPVYLSEDGRDAAVAAVGLQMKYSKFYDTFMNKTRHCPRHKGSGGGGNGISDCQETCLSDQIDCFLLDENGYVVLSENYKELGQFFGSLDGSASLLMNQLIIDDQHPPSVFRTGVFKKVHVYDHQAMCEIWKNTSSRSPESRFRNPFRGLYSSIWKVLNELVMFALELNLISWWNNGYMTVKASFANDTYLDLYEESPNRAKSRTDHNLESSEDIMSELSKIAPVYQVNKWRNDCVDQTSLSTTTIAAADPVYQILQCLRNIKKQYEPGVIGHKSCIKSYTHYIADPMQLPYCGTLLNKCESCSKSFSINNVPRTNLILLAVDSLCYCNSEPAMSIQPIEISYNDSVVCQKNQQENYRVRPVPCYSHHLHEDSSDCGRGTLLRHSFTLLLIAQLLTLSISRSHLCPYQ